MRFWKKKIKVFMWKVVENFFMNPICQTCYNMSENVFHALMDCKAGQKVWKSTNFYKDMKMMGHQDMLIVLQEFIVKRKKKDLEQIIAVCWAICYVRSRFVIERKQENPQLLVVRVIAIVESYKKIKTPNDLVKSIHH